MGSACARGPLPFRAEPSSAPDDALVSSSSVKFVLLLLVAAAEGAGSEGDGAALPPWLSLVEQGRESGGDKEQLDACLNLLSWAGEGKPRELSPTAPK